MMGNGLDMSIERWSAGMKRMGMKDEYGEVWNEGLDVSIER